MEIEGVFSWSWNSLTCFLEQPRPRFVAFQNEVEICSSIIQLHYIWALLLIFFFAHLTRTGRMLCRQFNDNPNIFMLAKCTLECLVFFFTLWSKCQNRISVGHDYVAEHWTKVLQFPNVRLLYRHSKVEQDKILHTLILGIKTRFQYYITLAITLNRPYY